MKEERKRGKKPSVKMTPQGLIYVMNEEEKEE
jgi:hypothetical protein